MEQKQIELLERVLLLMKYDNKDTLSENLSKVEILVEQPNPNKVPKTQTEKDAIVNCKTQPRNYNWSGFAPRNKESVDKFCRSLELNYPSFYQKTTSSTNPNPQTTQQKKKYTTEELKKYSVEQLINLYGKEAEGTSKVSFGTNKDNIIKAFAEKVSQLDYTDLIKLVKTNKIFRDSLYYSDSPTGTIQQPRSEESFKGNVNFWGPLVVLVDYEIFERKIGDYNKNPRKTNYQPPIEPNWKDLINKFKLSSLKQYQYSPTQYLTKIKQEEQGLKGYTQKGYPTYEKDSDALTGGYLNIQKALVQLGYLKEKDISKTHTSNIHYSWYNSLRDYLQSGNYEFGSFLGITNDNPDRMQIIENYICMLKEYGQVCEGSRIGLREMPIYSSMINGTGASELILSFLRANAYPNIPADEVLYEKGQTPKEQKEKFEKSLSDGKYLKISIYDVNGKVTPIYSRGDDPNLPTYSLESEGFELEPQDILLGPVFSILTDKQVETLVNWLVEYCTEPVEVNGVTYGRRIVVEGGYELAKFYKSLDASMGGFFKDIYQNQFMYPNCVVDFANKETDGDVGKWMIKFLKLPEDQVELLLQFYPEDYDLIQTYLPGAPGSKQFYLNSPLVKNAVKMHISKNPGSQLGVMSSLYAGTGSGDYPLDEITDSMVETVIKKLLKDCPGMNKELKAIASGERKHKGYIVGQYYESLKGYINYTIPCPDEFWDEYGWAIVMGGVLLASLVFPPLFLSLGVELELAIAARIAVDVGLNVYSAYRNKLAGNEEMAKIDLACAFLSFVVDTPGFEKTFLKGFGDWAEISVFNKIKKARPSSAKKWRQFVSSLTEVERRHLYDILNSPRFMRGIRVYGQEALQAALKKEFGPAIKNAIVKIFREVGIKLPVVFSPVMLNLGYKIFIYLNQVSQKIFKVPLDETKWRAFEWALKQNGVNTQEQGDEFFNQLLQNKQLQFKFIKDVGEKLMGEQFEKIKPQINTTYLDSISQEANKYIKIFEELNKETKKEAEK